jgi:hypothetical protein
MPHGSTSCSVHWHLPAGPNARPAGFLYIPCVRTARFNAGFVCAGAHTAMRGHGGNLAVTCTPGAAGAQNQPNVVQMHSVGPAIAEIAKGP